MRFILLFSILSLGFGTGCFRQEQGREEEIKTYSTRPMGSTGQESGAQGGVGASTNATAYPDSPWRKQ